MENGKAAAFKWVNVCLYYGKGMLFQRFKRFFKEMHLEETTNTYQTGKLQKIQEGRKEANIAEHIGGQRRPPYGRSKGEYDGNRNSKEQWEGEGYGQHGDVLQVQARLSMNTEVLFICCYIAAAAANSLQLCPTLRDLIDGSHQAPPSLGFSRQEHWSGLPFPSPMPESEKRK